MPPNLGGFFMVRSYYPSECHADYFDFERIEALKPAIEACGISTLSQSPMLGFHKQMDNRIKDKLCLIFKLAPSVCRMTFPILASLLVRLVVLLPFQLLRLSLATPSRWTPLALSVFLHCVVALLLTLL